jgi:hypothetical protein
MDERPDDFEVVRAVLARQRRLGMSFEEAWPLALRVLDGPTPSLAERQDRDTTLTALARTEEDWRRAYERLPARPTPNPMVALDALVVA